ncbi:MAG: hypothetical protein D6765_15900 [Bacteroidetes bacterium]|nr:MAG: hypothetical protein D6765_15900 [Bacteroidota bacterium]
MKSLSLLLFVSLVVWGLLSSGACTADELPPPPPPAECDTLQVTYVNFVKPIIDESCAYAGCHDGLGGIGPGDYTTYDGMLPVLNGGQFKDRVFDRRDDPVVGMPPDKSVYPESQKDNLTSGELDLLRCWMEAGFPEQ